jgi:hypothetical protein
MNVTLEVSRYEEDEARLALTSQTRVVEELERRLLESRQILQVLRWINNLSDGWGRLAHRLFLTVFMWEIGDVIDVLEAWE